MAIRFRLRELIDKKGLTQTDVQMATRLAYSTINDLYNNKTRRIDLETLNALCEGLGCQPGDLLAHVADGKRGHKPDRA